MKLPLKHEPQFCSGCPLRKNTQKKTLYIPTEINYRDTQEDGKPKIDVLIVAETPGFNEDYQGRPLVSDAGIEIHNAIEKAGLGATTAYTTAVRCRPTDGNKNRPPILEEIAACKNYVLMDINYLQPKVVVLVGNVAVQALCPNPEWKDKKINAIKGEVYAKDGITYLVTVNPSTYLHSNSYIEKKRFEDSIKSINRILSGEQQVYARKGTVQFLGTLAEVKDFVDLVKTMPLNNYDNVPGIGYDTETRNLNRYAANELISMQFALDNNIGFFIPVNHPESPFKGDLVDKLRDLLIDLFTFNAPFEYWIAHNGLFDLWRALHFLKIKRLAKRIIDTLYVEYLRDENQRSNDEDAEGAGGFSRIDLKTLSRDKLAFYHYDPYVLEARKQPDGLWNLPLYESGKRVSRLVDYGGMDSYVGRRLLCHQVVDLGDYSEAAMRLALKWDARVSHLYAKMEKNGIYADRQQLDFLGSEKSPIITRLKEIPTEILDTPEGKKANKIALQRDPKTSGMKPLFGKTPIIWNIAKKAHRQALLIDACGLEPVGFGKDKVTPSIDKAFYQHHKDNPLVQKMQEFTGLEKLRTSYVNSVIRELDNSEDNKVDGRVHAHFHSTRTVTGRGATTDPNLGQVPRNDNHAKAMIKSMYGADLGRMIIEADYAQSEVRWWAQISGDEEFAALFHRMKAKRMAYLANPTPELAKEVKLHCDVHRQVASIMHQITLEEVTKPLRQGAKNLTFGSLYGQHHTTLAGILGITKEKALELQNTFVKQFTRAGNWLTEIENFAVKNLYVDSPFGRRRHLEPMFRINEQAAKRRARNSPIQAASSDTMFLAACRFQEWLEDNNLDHIIRIVNTVHDAIILDVPIDYDIVHLAITNLERCMVDINDFLYAEFGIKMIVPMESDFKMGKRWGHCFDLDAAGSNVLVDKIRVWDDKLKNGTPWYYIATEMHANDTVKKAEKVEKEFLQAKENGDPDIKKKKKELELARKNADTAQQMFESLAA